MRLIVDDLPRTPKECLFGWKHIEYSKWRCKFGRECELSAECRQCSHLVTFATDKNVATKLSTNLAEVGTNCSEFPNNSDTISRQAAIDALHMHLMYRMGTDSNKKRLDDWINSLPPIQPKRGRWHYSDGKPARIGLSFGVVCDQCGTESEYCTNFCGECGADMRGEQNG